MIRVVREHWAERKRPATLKYLARRIGCTPSTIYNRLRTEGVHEVEVVEMQVDRWLTVLGYAPRDRVERKKKKEKQDAQAKL